MTIDDCIRDVVGYEGKYKINIVGEVFKKMIGDIKAISEVIKDAYND